MEVCADENNEDRREKNPARVVVGDVVDAV
jgi:hypothetical protein